MVQRTVCLFNKQQKRGNFRWGKYAPFQIPKRVYDANGIYAEREKIPLCEGYVGLVGVQCHR